ncbi:allantoin permease [Longimycelium tulufanense]|uniref:Allantoin permease n=1 Tax=Longimycelium tulufanense TaxID=907463 RepID=A0A8J3CLJ5_9PSEU|nr:cytosine permease [Longimycelium tulufanense]GGM83484.1 allantoin permease [Longimycelium tulufanense]
MSGDKPDAATGGWVVERRGIDWIPDHERHGRPRMLVWPWAGANLSFFPIAYGVFVVGLGLNWWQAMVAVAIGVGVSYPLVGLVAVAGTRGGSPTMMLSRAAFGHHGNKLPTALSYLSLVGWETVSVTLGVLATRTVVDRLQTGFGGAALLAASFAVIAGATIMLAVYGYDVIMRVHKWVTIAVGAMTVLYLVVILPGLQFSPSTHSGSLATLIGGITLAATATGLGWTNCGADYSRYLPRRSSARGILGWTAAGGGTPPLVLMMFGLLLTAGDPHLADAVALDPIGALANSLPTWFLVPFLLTVLLSMIAGAVVNLYSSGLNLLALGVRVSRPVAVGIDGILMVLGGTYLIFVAPNFLAPFQAFLTTVGVGMASWAAIFLTDLFLHRRHGYSKNALSSPTGAYGRWNLAATLSFLAAVVAGLGLVTSSDRLVGQVLGYFLTPEAQGGSLGATNIGVAVAFLIAGTCYGLLSTTVLPPDDNGRSTSRALHRHRGETRHDGPHQLGP